MAVGQRYVEIPLDKLRKVKYNINCMREIEIEFGGGFRKMFDAENMGFDHVTKLLFFGLKYGDRDNLKAIPTLQKLGDVLQKHWFDADKGDLADIINLILDGMRAGKIIPEDSDLEAEMEDEDNEKDPLEATPV